ncbi:MAG: hypothetical protein AAF750_15160 [Planctomycetota bacterium]
MEPTRSRDNPTPEGNAGLPAPVGGAGGLIPVGLLGQRVAREPSRVSRRVRVHRRLRRYYAQLLISAVGFGLIGALLGYQYAPLRYEAEAVLHFQALGPGSLEGGGGAAVGAEGPTAARLASVLEGYAEQLEGAGALGEGVQGEAWRVDRSAAGSGVLRVLAEADDPASSSSALNQRVRALRDSEPGAAWRAGVSGVKAQREKVAGLTAELADAEAALDRRRQLQGAVSIEGQLITLERRLMERSAALDSIENDLAVFEGQRGVVLPGGPEADRVLDHLAAGDAVLKERLERWRTIRLGLEQAAAIRPEFEAWLLDRGYRQPLRELDGMVQDVLAETRLIDGEPVRRSALQRRRLVVRGEVESAEASLTERRREQAAQREAEARIAMLRREVSGLDTRIAEATATLPVSAALTEPIQWATPPSGPVRDTRPWFAAVGGLVAAGFGVLMLLPLALRDRSMRRPDAAVLRDAAAPLIAALPVLKSVADGQAPMVGGGAKALPPPADPGEAAHAAAAISDLRVLLESNAAPLTDAKTVCLVSPATGTGVTSLTLGLSTALAQAGTRTLLVDIAGLASPRLSAAPADPTLDQALTQSRLLDPDEADLLLSPQEQRLGLPAFLDGQPLSGCTLETRLPTLSLLPSLTAQPGDPDRLAGRVLDRLRYEARRGGYDAVLIDAGVVPGRSDALLAAAAADATLLVLAPNLDQRRFNHALAQLRLVHAQVLGSVFNRAQPRQATTPAPDPKATPIHRPPVAPLRGSGLFAAAMGFNEPASFGGSGFGRHAGSGLVASSATSLSGMPYLGDEPEASAPSAVEGEGAVELPDVFAPTDEAGPELEGETDDGARVLPRPIQVEADPDVDAFVEAMISKAARRPSDQPGKTTHADDPPQRTAKDEPAPEPAVQRGAPGSGDGSLEEGAAGRQSLSDRLAAAAEELSEPFAAEPGGAAAEESEDLSDEALARDLEAQACAEREAGGAGDRVSGGGEAETAAQLDAALDDLANEALILLRSDLAKQQEAGASGDVSAPSPPGSPPLPQPERPA